MQAESKKLASTFNMGKRRALRLAITPVAVAPAVLIGLATTPVAAEPTNTTVANPSLWATFTSRPTMRDIRTTPTQSNTPTPSKPNTLTPRGNNVGSFAKLPQKVTPRVSLAETPLPTKISMVMRAGGSGYTTKATVRRVPVASYPLFYNDVRVRTVALPSTATQATQRNIPGSTTRKPVNTPAKPADTRHGQKMLLAQLEAELNRSQSALSRADQQISDGQRQLGRWGGLLRQAMMEAGPDARGLHPFVKVAQRYAGTPYVWGGESRYGFDCSGFIMVVMRDLGYRALPHSAAEQFTYGKPIAQPLLKPGDLVFFKNTYKPGISHVGIYLGKRRFIHAAGTGKGTIVSNLDDGKYQSHYAGGRRLVPARS